MKFNVEVEIDWLGEDDTLDEKFERRVLESLTKLILEKFSADVSKQIANNAASLVKAKTEMLINAALETPVVISDGYRKVEYESILDMVEKKMTALYAGKLDVSGQCKKDPLLANIEAYVKSETEKNLMLIDKKVKTIAEVEAKKAVNESELIKAIGIAIKKVGEK